MEFLSNYEISSTTDFIRSNNFTKIALQVKPPKNPELVIQKNSSFSFTLKLYRFHLYVYQFPDELLKDSTKVSKALKNELGKGVRLYVMADTAYGSCCVDEIAASHVDAECVVHYGHACMSPTSKLPALFVYGKAKVDADDCAKCLSSCISASKKPVLVLYGLEYAHALQDIRTTVAGILPPESSNILIHYADVLSSIIYPLEDKIVEDHHLSSVNSNRDDKVNSCTNYELGGLKWNVPVNHNMDDFLLFWIGSDDPAFANLVLTFNNSEVVRYDAKDGKMLTDFSSQKRILRRRYYLVEKAKDANIVGILVGTLGVAGYLHIVHQIKELLEGAGKKYYTLIMGRPNSAKLANFPECDVFIYVSCAQTALLDSKEFLAPVITPFEAVLAFTRGRQWTGEYVMEFRNLINSSLSEPINSATEEEARFSFIQGGYVEDSASKENEKEKSLDLVEATEKALSLKSESINSILFKRIATSGAEYFAARTYQGLNMEFGDPSSDSYIIGRTGRAAGYKHEIDNPEDTTSE